MAWRRSSQPSQQPRNPPGQNRERNPSVRGGGDAPRPTDKVTRPPPGRRDSQPQVKSPGQANQATQARQEMESHRSVNGFNADLVKEDMRKAYAKAVAEVGDEKALMYKVSGETRTASQPWGSRPNQMANGQNFWVEFAKQVQQMEDKSRGEKK